MSRNSVLTLLLMLVFAGMLMNGCAQPAQQPAAPEITRAVAVLHPTAGNDVEGEVWFTKTADGIEIEAHVSGLEPGDHGFHIHEWGDCSAEDGTSARGHFNPDNAAHAGPEAAARHVGDLGNLQADDQGEAHYARVDKVIAFSGAHSIIGRAVIVHAAADDLTSPPTGNAGARVACGVIGIAQPQP